MRINSVKQIHKAEDLKRLIEMRLFVSKKEEELKQYFKDLMGDDEVLYVADRFVITLEPRSRVDLDKDKLRKVFGERLEEFETMNTYKILNIKQAK